KMRAACEFGALQLNTDYRVLLASPGVFNDASVAYFHKSIGGYHAAKLKRYQEVIDFYLSDEINRVTEGIKSGSPAVVDSVLGTTPVINMLNTKYVKYSGSAPPISNEKHALGNAWFVKEIQWASNANEEMQALGSMNSREKAVVHEEFKSQFNSWGAVDSSATAVLTKYATRKLTYSVSTPQPAPLIFSEIYYPEGWVCRIDGNEVPAFRANYFLRGVQVPAGEHSVEWSFEPKSYATGVTVNMAGSVSLVVLMLLVFGAELWRWSKKPVIIETTANQIENITLSSEDEIEIGWQILAFLIPIAGIIMYVNTRKEFPNKAKRYIQLAAVGIVLDILSQVFLML
ncbi:MAG: hypothetical protein ACKO7B_03420, partial [Flavobacteriales bacterium]